MQRWPTATFLLTFGYIRAKGPIRTGVKCLNCIIGPWLTIDDSISNISNAGETLLDLYTTQK